MPTENKKLPPVDAPAADAQPVDLTAGAVAALEDALTVETPKAAEPEPAPSGKSTPEGAEPDDVPGEPAAESAKPAEKTVDEEVAEFGLKEKSAARFRELSGYKAAFHESGIEKLEDLPRIVERAKFADELENAIVETGASPEQYGMAIKWLSLANSGKPEDAAQALDLLMETAKQLAQAVGREIPGVHDPLADHPDLLEEVEAGDITRKRAVEIAQQRAATQLTKGVEEQTQEQQRQKAEYQQAVAGLNALGAQLQARDPRYAEKIAVLAPTIALIRENFPPAEWQARMRDAYSRVVLPAPAPAPAQALPPPGPVRSVVPAGVQMQPEPKSAMEALEMALAAANGNR